MTISSTSAQAAAETHIKRQSMSKAGTNGGIQRGGGWECEKVNSKIGQDASPQTGNSSRQTTGATDRKIYIQTVLSRGM